VDKTAEETKLLLKAGRVIQLDNGAQGAFDESDLIHENFTSAVNHLKLIKLVGILDSPMVHMIKSKDMARKEKSEFINRMEHQLSRTMEIRIFKNNLIQKVFPSVRTLMDNLMKAENNSSSSQIPFNLIEWKVPESINKIRYKLKKLSNDFSFQVDVFQIFDQLDDILQSLHQVFVRNQVCHIYQTHHFHISNELINF